MSLSKQLSNSLEGIPSIHLDPGDPGSPDPDCSNPKKQPAAAPSNPSLDSGSLFKIAIFGMFKLDELGEMSFGIGKICDLGR